MKVLVYNLKSKISKKNAVLRYFIYCKKYQGDYDSWWRDTFSDWNNIIFYVKQGHLYGIRYNNFNSVKRYIDKYIPSNAEYLNKKMKLE